MKNVLFIFTLLAIASTQLLAQTTTRKVTLDWEDTANPAGTTYTLYRAKGACAQETPTWEMLQSSIAPKTFEDLNVTPGKYCYVATAVVDAVESDHSNRAEAQVKPFAPINMKATFTIEVTVPQE